jgi:transcriptional regulator with XRE-family HTH domain
MEFYGAPPVTRRRELGEFLRVRRSHIRPEDVGISAQDRRRSPGLRREEVAVLANVSLSWYAWLEQGKNINVSVRVLEAIGSALDLNDCERLHLYYLAGMTAPSRVPDGEVPDATLLMRIASGWAPNPAFVLDRHWNVVSANRQAQDVFGVSNTGYNCLISFFTRSDVRRRYLQEESLARGLVAELRGQVGRFPGDPEYASLVGRLAAGSSRFAELWERHEVVDAVTESVVFRHAVLGDLVFDPAPLDAVDRFAHRLILYTPAAASDTGERLAWLDSRTVP